MRTALGNRLLQLVLYNFLSIYLHSAEQDIGASAVFKSLGYRTLPSFGVRTKAQRVDSRSDTRKKNT